MTNIITLPMGLKVATTEYVIKNGHFTWGEVTKKGNRQVNTKTVMERIIYTAERMEVIRTILGNHPIYVSSWLRDVQANKRAGGAVFSRHLFGDAVDFFHPYFTPIQVYKRLDHHHHDGGLACYKKHVHIDFRGQKARW